VGKIEFDTPRKFKRIAFRGCWSSQEAYASSAHDFKLEAYLERFGM
jgi:hypothetical protein